MKFEPEEVPNFMPKKRQPTACLLVTEKTPIAVREFRDEAAVRAHYKMPHVPNLATALQYAHCAKMTVDSKSGAITVKEYMPLPPIERREERNRDPQFSE